MEVQKKPLQPITIVFFAASVLELIAIIWSLRQSYYPIVKTFYIFKALCYCGAFGLIGYGNFTDDDKLKGIGLWAGVGGAAFRCLIGLRTLYVNLSEISNYSYLTWRDIRFTSYMYWILPILCLAAMILIALKWNDYKSNTANISTAFILAIICFAGITLVYLIEIARIGLEDFMFYCSADWFDFFGLICILIWLKAMKSTVVSANYGSYAGNNQSSYSPSTAPTASGYANASAGRSEATDFGAVVQKLEQFKQLYEMNIISKDEFEAQKAELIAALAPKAPEPVEPPLESTAVDENTGELLKKTQEITTVE